MIVEVRIPLPFEVDEFEAGNINCVTRESEVTIKPGIKCLDRTVTKGKDGKTTLKTIREFNYSSFFPSTLVKLLPSLKDVWFKEVCTTTWPDVITETRSDYFGDKFKTYSASKYVPNDSGDSENVFNLDKKKLAKREVVVIDLLHTKNDTYLPNNARDVKVHPRFNHIKERGWFKKETAPACCYTLLDVHVKVFAIGSKVEGIMKKDMIDRLHLARVNAVQWYDDWKNMTVEEAIREDLRFEARAHAMQHLAPAPHHIELEDDPIGASADADASAGDKQEHWWCASTDDDASPHPPDPDATTPAPPATDSTPAPASVTEESDSAVTVLSPDPPPPADPTSAAPPPIPSPLPSSSSSSSSSHESVWSSMYDRLVMAEARARSKLPPSRYADDTQDAAIPVPARPTTVTKAWTPPSTRAYYCRGTTNDHARAAHVRGHVSMDVGELCDAGRPATVSKESPTVATVMVLAIVAVVAFLKVYGDGIPMDPNTFLFLCACLLLTVFVSLSTPHQSTLQRRPPLRPVPKFGTAHNHPPTTSLRASLLPLHRPCRPTALAAEPASRRDVLAATSLAGCAIY